MATKKIKKVDRGIGANAVKSIDRFMDSPSDTRWKEGTATKQDSANYRGWSEAMGDYSGKMPKVDTQQAFADTKIKKSSTAPKSKVKGPVFGKAPIASAGKHPRAGGKKR